MAVTLTRAAIASLLLLNASAAMAEVKLQFWYSAGEKVILTLVERFEAQNPGIDIEPVSIGNYANGTVRLQAAAASGDVPALAQIEITRYGLFAAAGVLEPLDARLAAEPAILADLRPFAREAALYLGKSYVLPFNVSNPLLYYNKDLFRAAGLDPEAPPATWDALVAASQALTLRDGETVSQWGVNPPPQWVRWAMANQAGGGWMDGATNENLMGRPETARAYQFAADLVNVHRVAQLDAAMNDDLAVDLFTSGRAAIHFDSTGSLGAVKKASAFDMGVAALPCEAVCAAPVGGAALGIFAGAPDEQKEAAWAFLKFIMTPDSNAEMFTVTGYLPILHSTADHPQAKAHLAANPEWSVAITQLKDAFVRARPPAMPEIRAIEPTVWERIVLKQATAAEALRDFSAEIDRLMAAN